MSKKNRISMRKFYEKETGRLLPKDFDVHHIDLQPENNDISNLLALPRKIHQEYHEGLKAVNWLNPIGENYFIPKKESFCKEISYLDTHCLDYALNNINKMRDIYFEYCHWFNFKSFLQNKFPNPTGGRQY